MKKAISLFLAFSILLLSGNMFAQERKGAELFIEKNDGQQIKGELIAVKQTSLLLKEFEKEIDVTVDIGDVRVIKILKKSKALLGGMTGLILGGVGGYMIGYPQGSKSGWFISQPQAGGIGLAIGGAAGVIIGAAIGAGVGTDEIIPIKAKSELEIKEVLEKLRKKARVKNYQ